MASRGPTHSSSVGCARSLAREVSSFVEYILSASLVCTESGQRLPNRAAVPIYGQPSRVASLQTAIHVVCAACAAGRVLATPRSNGLESRNERVCSRFLSTQLESFHCIQ